MDLPHQKKLLFIVTLAAVLLLGIVAFFVFYLNKPATQNTSEAKPTLTQVVTPTTEYANPFDDKTQYQNPFKEEKNPFDNLAQ